MTNEELFKGAPDWVNWIAKDSDGFACWFECKPIAHISIAYDLEWRSDSEGRDLINGIEMGCHWSHSLIERVR